MKALKRILIIVLLAAIISAGAGGAYWHSQHYVMIDYKFYSTDAESLDLRGQELTIKQYERFREKIPGCSILWDVPFQGHYYPEDTQELAIASLSDEDMDALEYLPKLKSIDATACEDYEQLQLLETRFPEVEVSYYVTIGGTGYDPNTKELVISFLAEEEFSLLKYLKQLDTIVVNGIDDLDYLQLRSYCRENSYAFKIAFGEALISETEEEITLHDTTAEELRLLELLPNLKKVELITPQAPAEDLVALQGKYANVEITWSQEIAGILLPCTETLIDISGAQVTDLEAVAKAMTYFPNATQLEMHNCGVGNEAMAAFREAHRSEYKVVWTVMLGPKLPTRTDTTSIMPARDGTSVFHDEEAYNMRYCEDVIAVDVGHLDVRNVEWAAYMPHLKYLILAWTGVRDLTPLSNCKELVWLEIDYSPVTDTTPLIGCTALEDINIGKSGVSANGLVQMPWLKNVWAIGNPGAAYEVAQACPDTHVVASGTHSVGSGWRKLPNYYKMRDALNMFYMDQ